MDAQWIRFIHFGHEFIRLAKRCARRTDAGGIKRKYGNQLNWKVTQDTVETPCGAKAIGFSTTDGGKFEGFHADDHYKVPLAILVDEAKSVEKEIFDAIERCRPTRLLVQSSPGGAGGGFYNTCQDPRFRHFKATAFDCPHLGAARAKEVEQREGSTETMLYKSMIMGEWMVDPNQTFICTQRAIDRALMSNPVRRIGPLIAFMDVAHAEGGNENVLAIRYGNILEIDDAFRGSGNAYPIVDRLINRLQRRRVHPNNVFIDGDGMGALYHNIFTEKGWNINIWKGSSQARDFNTYYNLSAEAWMNLARSIEKCELVFPNDDRFHNQLTGREYFINNKGKIQLMPKDGDSPDRADALAGAWSIPHANAVQIMGDMSDDEWHRNEPDMEWALNHNITRSRYEDMAHVLPKGWNCGI